MRMMSSERIPVLNSSHSGAAVLNGSRTRPEAANPRTTHRQAIGKTRYRTKQDEKDANGRETGSESDAKHTNGKSRSRSGVCLDVSSDDDDDVLISRTDRTRLLCDAYRYQNGQKGLANGHPSVQGGIEPAHQKPVHHKKFRPHAAAGSSNSDSSNAENGGVTSESSGVTTERGEVTAESDDDVAGSDDVFITQEAQVVPARPRRREGEGLTDSGRAGSVQRQHGCEVGIKAPENERLLSEESQFKSQSRPSRQRRTRPDGKDGGLRTATARRTHPTESSHLLTHSAEASHHSGTAASGTDRPDQKKEGAGVGRGDEVEGGVTSEDGEEEKTPQKGLSSLGLSRRQKGMFLLLAFSNFFACTCFSLLAPFFPAEAASQGMSQTLIGLVFSCFEFCMFLACPLVGKFMTLMGPKYIFVTGQFLAGACSILFGPLYLCPPGVPFITLCFLTRIVQALGAAAFVTASFAIVANEFPSAVTTMFATLEVFTGLGYTAGPLFGGILYEAGGFGAPFYVMGALLISCSLTAHFVMTVKPDVHEGRPVEMSMLRLVVSPLVVVASFSVIVGCFTFGLMDATLATHLQQFQLSPTLTGLMFVIVSSLYALGSPFWGRISDKMDIQYPLLIGGHIMTSLALLLLGPSPLLPLKTELWLIIVSLSLMGCCIGATVMPALKCIYRGARRLGYREGMDLDGLVSGLLNSAFHGGAFLGPTIGSAVQEALSYEWAVTFNAGLCLVAAYCLVLYLVVEKLCLKYNNARENNADDDENSLETSLLVEASPPRQKVARNGSTVFDQNQF